MCAIAEEAREFETDRDASNWRTADLQEGNSRDQYAVAIKNW